MSEVDKVAAYLEKQTLWKVELEVLRAIFLQTELREEIKWGCPTYTLDGKLVAGFAAFKNHYAIWFHHGVFLKDPYKKLHNAQEGKTQGLRQWKFVKGDSIPSEMIREYLHESIENSKAGKQIKPSRPKSVVIPSILLEALSSDKDLYGSFQRMTPGRQREYAEYIGSAKKVETQISRLQTIIPLILKGVGLNDKYRNC